MSPTLVDSLLSFITGGRSTLEIKRWLMRLTNGTAFKIFHEAWMTLCVQATPKVQCQWPEAKMIEDEARMATYLCFAQLQTFRAGFQQNNNVDGRFRYIKGPWINSIHKHWDSAHDLSVKLSPCICSHSSCPGRTNDCNLLAYVMPSYPWWWLSYLYIRWWQILVCTCHKK